MLRTTVARSETQAAKYWTIRRESFALLRKNLKGLYAAPFIDDLVVHPGDYARFLPELDALLKNRRFIYTIAGHIGDGNFHIIPLEDMHDPQARTEILDLMPKVYALVAKYKGSITGEHNDGILRTLTLSFQYDGGTTPGVRTSPETTTRWLRKWPTSRIAMRRSRSAHVPSWAW